MLPNSITPKHFITSLVQGMNAMKIVSALRIATLTIAILTAAGLIEPQFNEKSAEILMLAIKIVQIVVSSL